MPRTMYDSTNIADIPAHADMVAVYVDGAYRNHDQARQRFPNAKIVTITVNGGSTADVIDCEAGDATPAGAAAWAKRMITQGRHPTIYCSASPWPTVKAAVRREGIKAGQVSWWIAQYDGHAQIPAGAVAKQYLGSPGNSPGHYDVSVVADYWPGVDKPPAPPLSDRKKRQVSKTTRQLKHRRKPLPHGKRSGRTRLRRLLRQIRRLLGR